MEKKYYIKMIDKDNIESYVTKRDDESFEFNIKSNKIKPKEFTEKEIQTNCIPIKFFLDGNKIEIEEVKEKYVIVRINERTNTIMNTNFQFQMIDEHLPSNILTFDTKDGANDLFCDNKYNDSDNTFIFKLIDGKLYDADKDMNLPDFVLYRKLRELNKSIINNKYGLLTVYNKLDKISGLLEEAMNVLKEE